MQVICTVCCRVFHLGSGNKSLYIMYASNENQFMLAASEWKEVNICRRNCSMFLNIYIHVHKICGVAKAALFIVPNVSQKQGTLKLIRPSVCQSIYHKYFNLAHIF